MRKTTIIDDATALAIGSPAPKKTKKSKTLTDGLLRKNVPKDETTHRRTTTAPKTAPRAVTPVLDTNRHQYYEANGLRIPLLHENGRRKAGARAASGLLRYNKQQLLDIVEDYAGVTKRRDLENLDKKNIAAWIEDAETQAFGANKKRARDTSAAQDDEDDVTNTTMPATKKMKRNDAIPNVENNVVHATEPVVKKTKVSTTIQIVTEKIVEDVNADVAANRKKLVPFTTKTKSMVSTPANDATKPNGTTSTVSLDTTSISPRSNMKAIKVAAELAPDLVLDADFDDELQAMMEQVQAHIAEQSSSAEVSTTIPKDNTVKLAKHNLKVHPMIHELGLNPDDPSQATKIIGLPEHQELVIITASSWTAVHETRIPTAPPVLQQSQNSLYLKPGKHGWDWNLHKWAFYGDRDLETGVGHQIEPADQERLEKEPAFEYEFKKKYPGVLANQWPCGCQKPWYDDESEEE